jgi:hypothetical protein
LEQLETRLVPASLVTISDATLLEPDLGSSSMSFRVTRTGSLAEPLTVGYFTSDGTAEAGSDYTARSGTVTIHAGSDSATIRVPVRGDTLEEEDETFFVTLTGVGGGPADLADPVRLTTGTRAYAVAVADFDGDGRPDLAVANAASHNVSVLRNTTAPGDVDPSFAAAQNFTTGNTPYSVAAADFNGDGKPDLAVVNSRSATVSVLLNTTNGGAINFAAKRDFKVGSLPRSVAAADFNGDGRPDLAVANFASNSVSVLLNTANPGATRASFSSQQRFVTGLRPFSVAAGDLNDDGKPDLVVANSRSNSVSVLENTTDDDSDTASFEDHQQLPTALAPRSVALGDLNGDGKLDVATANFSGGASVMLNTSNGTPSFTSRRDFTVGTNPTTLVVADFNSDGLDDLAVGNHGGGNISLLLNTTGADSHTPVFAAQQQVAPGSAPHSLAVGDFNGDGKPDLAAGQLDGNSVAVLRNTSAAASGGGTIEETRFAVQDNPNAVALGDLDGDGKPDLAVVNGDSDSVSLLRNTTPGGAAPEFADQEEVFVGASPRGVALGDLNGDGRLDIVVANFDSSSVSVLLNATARGDSSFTFDDQGEFTTGDGPTAVALGDIDGDGRLDIVVANRTTETISVLLNQTALRADTAEFADHVEFGTGTDPMAVAVGDVTGDGLADVAFANAGSNNVSVLVNTSGAGAVSFATRRNFATAADPRAVAIGDVTGDGRADLVVANTGADTVSVHRNTTPVGDGTARFATRQEFDVGPTPLSVVVRDFDRDGVLDIITANSGNGSVTVLRNDSSAGTTSPSFTAQQFSARLGAAAVAVGDVNGDNRTDLAVANAGDDSVSVLAAAATVVEVDETVAEGVIINNDRPPDEEPPLPEPDELLVTINQADNQGDPTNATNILFTVVFSRPVNDFDASDVTLNGTAGATTVEVTGGGDSYTVAVSGMTQDGTVLATLAADVAVDDEGVPNLASTSSDNEVFYDQTRPTAAATGPNVNTGGANSYSFTVTYSDNLGLNINTLGNGDVRVTGPGGFDQLATLVSLNNNDNGTPRTATYRITPPGGRWDALDNGSYVIRMLADAVADTAGNAVVASNLRTFSVTVPTNGGGGQQGQATVTDVRVRFGSQSVSIPNGILPWVGINTIDIVFSADVDVQQEDLVLTGVTGGTYDFSGFSYDPSSRRASWTLASDLNIDRLTLSLDGDDDGDGNFGVTDLQGNFLQGGDFNLSFNTLPGDVNGTGAVDSNDLSAINNNRTTSYTGVNFFDVDGDGDVDTADFSLTNSRRGNRLP